MPAFAAQRMPGSWSFADVGVIHLSDSFRGRKAALIQLLTMRPDNASTEEQFYRLQYVLWLDEMIPSRVEESHVAFTAEAVVGVG